MSIRLTKPWIDLGSVDSDDLPAQLGVFELADGDGQVVYIGYAGGREPFGMRTALLAAAETTGATRYRCELTHGYLSRWEELLMVHRHDHGALPVHNDPVTTPKGTLSPGPIPGPSSSPSSEVEE